MLNRITKSKINAFPTKYQKQNKKQQNNNLSFRGYAAAPLKALYMQADESKAKENESDSTKNAISVFSELKNILRSANIDVKMQIGKKGVYEKPEDIRQNEFPYKDLKEHECSEWSQDNKVFFEPKDEGHKEQLMALLSNIEVKPEETQLKNREWELPSYLREKERFDEKIMPYFMDNIEGGNFFIGRKTGNSKYLLIGEESVCNLLNNIIENKKELSSEEIEKFNEEFKNIAPNNEDNIDIEFIEALKESLDTKRKDKNGDLICEIQNENIQELSSIKKIKAKAVINGVKNLLAKTFDVNDVTILPQQLYHLDLFLRPLDDINILASDPNKSIATLNELKEEIKAKLPDELKDKDASKLSDLIDEYEDSEDKTDEKTKQMLFASLILSINDLKDDTRSYLNEKKEAFNNVIKELGLKGFNVIKTFGEVGYKREPLSFENFDEKSDSDISYIYPDPKDSRKSPSLQANDSEDLEPAMGHDSYFNYINAIVHQKENKKLDYITNKVDMPFSQLTTHNIQEFLKSNNIRTLDERFEEKLKESTSKIDNFYLVGGEKDENAENKTIMSRFLSSDGGVHCMINELPDFKKWEELNQQAEKRKRAESPPKSSEQKDPKVGPSKKS